MAQSSAIEWTEATWNPVTGCSKVSPGCAHCYAETLTARFAGRPGYIEEHRPWTPENAAHNVRLHRERLEQPLRWRKPRVVFVNSMSDLFHELVPYEFIREVFNIMRRCDGGIVAATGQRDPSHTFQVLTKRPERALELWRDRKLGFAGWPVNVWLGTSIENARHAYRADVLREIPASVRFISAEPLLGSLVPALNLERIDWLIVGGESGPEARPMHPEWARELRDACTTWPTADLANRPAFFFKQWGAWASAGDGTCPGDICMSEDGDTYEVQRGYVCAHNESDGEWLRRVGKKAAGRLLDGREWNEMPEVAA